MSSNLEPLNCSLFLRPLDLNRNQSFMHPNHQAVSFDYCHHIDVDYMFCLSAALVGGATVASAALHPFGSFSCLFCDATLCAQHREGRLNIGGAKSGFPERS